jgi:serine/threonine protein kinase
MVSSLVRRGVCPNFIVMHGVFTCSYAPPESLWGNEETRKPRGKRFDKKNVPIQVTIPKGGEQGRFQYIRMELANEGDAEELIKRQNNEIFSPYVARSIFFQVAFSLFAAAEKFSIKHYDVKLLNIFVQNTHSVGDLVLRYGLGSHIFALRMPSSHPYIVKLADFGTANMMPTSTGLPITIAHFTTLENTPPDFMILGDAAKQGHGHDNFGLGLIMLHLFMGSRPYEEVLEDVKCPSNLKANLRSVWEDEEVHGYSIIRSLIFDGVDVDEYGNVEGVLDETLYDTLYRFLVLFGIPKVKFQEKLGRLVWNAIFDALSPSYHVASSARIVKKRSRKKANDVTTFKRDCKKFSIRTGNNLYISRARSALTALPGGIELLFCLCNFDPTIRASAMDVLNSTLMEDLRENPDADVDQYYDESTTVNSYMDFATITPQVN